MKSKQLAMNGFAVKDIVFDHKPKREILVQADTFVEGYTVHINEYEPTAAGVVQS